MELNRLVNSTYIHRKQFPVGTIILRLDNKTELSICDFHFHNGKLEVFCYKPCGKWKRGLLRNEYTKIMYDFYCKYRKKSNTHVNYERLMHHSSAKKHGSGGGCLGYSGVVTDYECRKEPLHDFRRSKYVDWH